MRLNSLRRAARFTVRASAGASELKLEVQDTGIGIPEAELQRVFERFYRVHRPGSQEAGTGLGLFIAREMALLHGRHIDVSSVVGKGTHFTVYLPLGAAGTDVVS